MASANDNVSTQRISGVFSHFCRVSRVSSASTDGANANVNLTLAGNVIRLRRNAVHIRDRLNGNDDFVMGLRLKGTRFSRRRVGGGTSDIRRVRVPGPRGSTLLGTRLRRDTPVGQLPSTGVLVIRSGSSVHSVLTNVFGPFCRILATTSKTRKLTLIHDRVPGVMIDSMMVPGVSKARLYGRVGDSFGAYRVPIMLLATHATVRRGVRKLHVNTSSCVAGPFGAGLLVSHYGGLIGSHVLLRRGFDGRPRTFMRVLTAGPVSGRVLSHTVTIVRRRLSSARFGIGIFTHRVTVTHAGLFAGLGTVAKRAPGSFVLAVHLGGNTLVLHGGPRLGVARVTSQVNFDSSHCFSGYFGSVCRIDPLTCHGKRGKKRRDARSDRRASWCYASDRHVVQFMLFLPSLMLPCAPSSVGPLAFSLEVAVWDREAVGRFSPL